MRGEYNGNNNVARDACGVYRVAKVIFCQRATNYRALLRKMTYQDKPSYASSSPCILFQFTLFRMLLVYFAWSPCFPLNLTHAGAGPLDPPAGTEQAQQALDAGKKFQENAHEHTHEHTCTAASGRASKIIPNTPAC